MGYIYINIFYKKLQFAAYGQFVLVFFYFAYFASLKILGKTVKISNKYIFFHCNQHSKHRIANMLGIICTCAETEHV